MSICHRLLPVADFLLRLSEHVPDPGFHVVRYAGLYAYGKRELLSQARAQLGMAPVGGAAVVLKAQDFLARVGQAHKMSCSQCKQRYVQREKVERSGRAPPLEDHRRAA